MSDTHDSNNPPEPKLVRVTHYRLTWFDADIEGGTKLQSADFDTREESDDEDEDEDGYSIGPYKVGPAVTVYEGEGEAQGEAAMGEAVKA